ncbi:MAG: GNAT family N-acetyltransferase [Myxococcales bacterium]|nr:GNAT family N-acetyltransferase [Myxococcales bacterium]
MIVNRWLDGFDVRLRPVTMDDLDAMMTWVNRPEVTQNFARLSRAISREEEAQWLHRTLESDADRLYAIEDRDGAYIGNAGLHQIYWPARAARLGVVVANQQGRGIGQQTIKLLSAAAFLDHGLHKVWLIHYRTNTRMAHITAKLGFAFEGVLRDEYFHQDGYHDMIRLSLLDHEFTRLRGSWGL